MKKSKELIQEWIKGNKQAIKSKNRDALFTYIRSNLQGVTEEQLMSNKIIKETINYIFSGEYSPENKNGARKKRKVLQKKERFTKKRKVLQKKERFYKKKERFYKKKETTQNKITRK